MSEAPAALPTAASPEALRALAELGSDLVVATDGEGRIAWANRRFSDAVGWVDCGGRNLLELPPEGAAGSASRLLIAAGLSSPSSIAMPASLRGPSGFVKVELRSARVGALIVWSLQDTTRLSKLHDEARRQSELLEMAQEFGRLGVWEREIPSGKGRWDRHVFGFWGLDPAQGTPNYPQATLRIHPTDRARMSYPETTRRAGRYAQRYRVVHPDGRTRLIHSQWEVKNGPLGVPDRALGIMMDDSEAFEAARALTNVNHQLEMAVALGNIAIWRHDLASNRIHYNAAAYAWIGKREDTDGVPLDEVRSLIHPDDLDAVAASAVQALRSGQPNDFEARYRRTDGSWRYILTRRALERDASGAPVAFVGVALDVSERNEQLAKAKELADALRTASERAGFIAAQAGVGMWEADLDGRNARWDEQMFILRGLPLRAEPPGREERLASVHPDDVGLILDSIEHHDAATLAAPAAYEFRIRQPDGTYRWIASRSAVIADEAGQPTRRVGVNWDVTESKSALLARQQAALAERGVQAKAQFLSRMSHELRTPLNAVLGFTQLLELEARQAGRPAELAKLAHIRAAGDHLLALIDDVLELSGLEAGELRLKLQPVELERVAAEAVSLLAGSAAERRIEVRIEAQGGVAQADPTRLRQVAINLLSNAIKYNRSGGSVVLQTRSEGEQVVFAVRDSGRGLSAEQVARLFEPFNRFGADQDGIQGTGIGLTIVKAIVDGMRGRIEVQSEPGRGASFIVTLPRASAPALPAGDALAAKTVASDGPAPARTGPGSILYIEDNHVNVLLVAELVNAVGELSLVAESSGRAGVARAQALRPDLILVDLQLPDFDGFEVLRQLRADPATATIPCIALSANAMPEDIARGRAAGFADYWTKPIDFAAFIAAMQRLFPAGEALRRSLAPASHGP